MIVQAEISNDHVLSQLSTNELATELTNRGVCEDLVVGLIEAKKLSIEMILGKLAVNKFMSMAQPKE